MPGGDGTGPLGRGPGNWGGSWRGRGRCWRWGRNFFAGMTREERRRQLEEEKAMIDEEMRNI
ncbi:hypothetical protein KY343_05675 [Candidatus Woesearchaeota archaeon]|nr:hypothetical protein [Candidatus Woesearchaeota archaeon]